MRKQFHCSHSSNQWDVYIYLPVWIIILAISLSRRTILDLGRQGKFETSEKCRSKLGHWSPYWFLLPSSCTLFIVRKWSYTFLWGGQLSRLMGLRWTHAFLVDLPTVGPGIWLLRATGNRWSLVLAEHRVDALSWDHLYECRQRADGSWSLSWLSQVCPPQGG